MVNLGPQSLTVRKAHNHVRKLNEILHHGLQKIWVMESKAYKLPAQAIVSCTGRTSKKFYRRKHGQSQNFIQRGTCLQTRQGTLNGKEPDIKVTRGCHVP